MKTIVQDKELLTLLVHSTGDELIEYDLPIKGAHYWYPFNVNFLYKHAVSKDCLHLTKEKGYTGKNIYGVKVLKDAAPLEEREGTIYHPKVAYRNNYIMERAKLVGIPVIAEDFTLSSVEAGFRLLSKLIRGVKMKAEIRCMDEEGIEYAPATATEAWDNRIYKYATAQECQILEEFAEMYTMLNLMRKIAERR
jgi:hypothetical protein